MSGIKPIFTGIDPITGNAKFNYTGSGGMKVDPSVLEAQRRAHMTLRALHGIGAEGNTGNFGNSQPKPISHSFYSRYAPPSATDLL
jgi:hypothetical protein